MKAISIFLCTLLLTAICTAEETEYLDWRGSQLYAEKNFTGALTYFDQAISQDSNTTMSWIHKGDAQKSLKDYNGSIQSYNVALQIGNNSRDSKYIMVWISKGDALKALKDYKGAIQSYKTALQIDPSKAGAWSAVADTYTTMGNYGDAIKAAAEATKLENKTANWLREGNLLQMQGMYKESVVKYDGVIALDPKHKDALYKKSISLMVLGSYVEAEGLLDQVLEIDPKYKVAYNAKGIALEANGKYEEALQSFDKALEIDPAYNQALVNKIQVLLALKKQKEAMQMFAKI